MNKFSLFFVCASLAIFNLSYASQNSQEILTQHDSAEQVFNFLNSDDEAFFDTVQQDAQLVGENSNDSFTQTSPLPFFTQPDAQPNDGYGSDYQSSQESHNVTYPQWLVRILQHHNSNARRRIIHVISDSNSDSDDDNPDAIIFSPSARPNSLNRRQRRRIVSPQTINELHRTNHVTSSSSSSSSNN